MHFFLQISTIFLGLLFVHVYRKSRQKLFGTMTLCLITMLFCFYICLVVGQYADVALVADHKVWCLVLGLLIQVLLDTLYLSLKY